MRTREAAIYYDYLAEIMEELLDKKSLIITSFLAFFTWFNLVIKISLVRSLLVSKTALATLILITLIALLLGLSFQEELMSLF